MLGLPASTELSRQLPKKAIYQKFNMNTAEREKFDADISRITIVNEVSPSTLSVSAGKDVQSIYVLNVLLKRIDFDRRIIEKLTKLIGQNILFVLSFDDKSMLAIHHVKTFCTDWSDAESLKVSIQGLNLDTIWQNIIIQVSGVIPESGNTLEQQIVINDNRAKLKKEIDRLEKLARKETQPKKKFELVKKINDALKQMEELYN